MAAVLITSGSCNNNNPEIESVPQIHIKAAATVVRYVPDELWNEKRKWVGVDHGETTQKGMHVENK